MKLEVLDAKKKFEQRLEEFKKQLDDYRKNNDVIDELKRAHAKELASYVQEHNKKYNDLLTEKLKSEDALKAKSEAEKASLIKDWTAKVSSEVKSARSEE